jgi:hypothetical protein
VPGWHVAHRGDCDWSPFPQEMKARVSGDRKALQVLVVGRLIDAFDEEIASVAAATARTYLPSMVSKRLPAGFIIPAQPVVASRPPSGTQLGFTKIARRALPAADGVEFEITRPAAR